MPPETFVYWNAATGPAIRKRSTLELAKLAVLTGTAALLTSVVGLGALLTVPTAPAMTFEPTPVINRTKAAELYHRESFGATRSLDSEFVMRRSVQMDEYGIQSTNRSSSGWRPWQLWEEYGLPMRCFRSTFIIETPRPPRREVFGLIFSETIPRLELLPIPFFLNVLIYAGVIFAVPRVPCWIISRHRRQEGRCIKCGYILKNLARCPECGTPAGGANSAE
jgi:hypothetical protein